MTWLIEEGIGEDRAIRLAGGQITDALVQWHGELAPGQVEDAVLIARAAGSPRGTARFASGELALVDHLPREAIEGAPLRLEVTRARIAEERRDKSAHARPSPLPPRPALRLAERLGEPGQAVEVVRRFPACDWDELAGEAFDRVVAFPGGALHFSPTPAMTLIDLDAALAPARAALAAVPAIAAALRRFGLGGSIGIDFPTLATKAERRAVDEALEAALAGWPHERTAMNGFGFVQLVARLERPSLLHRASFRRAGMAARLLLRRAEGLEGAGRIELAAHPAVTALLTADWLDALRRRTGRDCVLRADPGLAPEACHAQLVER